LTRFLFPIGALFAIVLLAAGCSGQTTSHASLGKEISLAIGESADIPEERFNVKFVDVTEDSRCPKGVTCIWAGQVTCAIEVAINGKLTGQKLTVTGGGPAVSQPVDGYLFAFTVEPYPEAGRQIARADYRLKLTVTK
jgi:hypothetical protein